MSVLLGPTRSRTLGPRLCRPSSTGELELLSTPLFFCFYFKSFDISVIKLAIIKTTTHTHTHTHTHIYTHTHINIHIYTHTQKTTNMKEKIVKPCLNRLFCSHKNKHMCCNMQSHKYTRGKRKTFQSFTGQPQRHSTRQNEGNQNTVS